MEGEGESGTPVWLLGIGNGVPANTPSVSNESSSGGGGGGSASSSSTRITGMYFYHPDHLGSITMITDGNGNVLASGERGGKSHISYKPYGEILRTDSYGPDITKFKYTGQEEDRESGLYYYKARYYDASLGRFISNDGMVFPGKTQGMNRKMYVEGNPMMWRDVSGNSTNYVHMFNQIVKHALGGRHKLDGSSVRSLGRTIDNNLRSIGRGLDYSGRKAGRAIDGGARSLFSGGRFSRNKGTDLDHLFGTGNFFGNIQKDSENIGRTISKEFSSKKITNLLREGLNRAVCHPGTTSASPLCQQEARRKSCLKQREKGAAYREKMGDAYTMLGGILLVAGLFGADRTTIEILGATLTISDVAAYSMEKQTCPGDSGPRF